MISAIILMNIERHKINETAELLNDMPEISEVFSVSGRYDLIAIVRVQNIDDLSVLVTNHLLKIDSIEKTDTLLAYKTYSKHDLDAMFSIGE
ncbi:MAG: Lrp/AsnC ligand binding domain-containing protein [Methylotenera sp.]|jgi:DNA-binding Lrp family transcriptional regulator|nr:Lrp/AsnC ligand binding domain-containing protein [Methylotenera sp.]MDP2280105.1 Lrp/AsnC ligand binding domain-containing protein [Methylotenera sp.]MDP3060619.1 Lrp/AsnC ligand binding domain-containing protein [Methylotenera sp.]